MAFLIFKDNLLPISGTNHSPMLTLNIPLPTDMRATSHGYEFVVPFDRKKNAKKYFYYAGTYSYQPLGDCKTGRLVPMSKVDPVATLIPQQAHHFVSSS